VTTSGVHKPRVIRVAPNGDVFVADSMFGPVHVSRIPAGHTVPEKHAVFARGLQQPFGIPSAMNLATTRRLNMPRMSLKAPSMAGPGTSSADTKIRGSGRAARS
jgi:hypothetical protein